MKRASAKGSKKKASAKSKSRKPVDLQQVRENITKLVGAEAEKMAGALADEGKKGQLAPAKFLFEMAGLFPATATAPEPEDSDDLAKVLLTQLSFPNHSAETEDVTENVAPGLAAGDSIE